MHDRTQPSAAPALVFLVMAFLFLGGRAPAEAQLIDSLGPGTLVVGPDGHRLYVTGRDHHSIDVIDTATQQLVAILSLPVGNRAFLGHPAVTPDGSLLYVPVDQEPPVGGTLQVLDLATGRVVATIPTERRPSNVLVSPDSRQVYVVYQGSETLSVMDAASGRVLATVPLGFNPLDAALTRDGKKLYVTSSSPSPGASSSDLRGRVAVIDTTTNRIKATVQVHHGPKAVATSSDGRWVYVTHWAYDASMVDVIATVSDELVDQPAPIPGGLSQKLVVSPDGRRLYVLPSPWNLAAAIDATTREVLGVAEVGQDPYDLTVSPDGRRLYVSHMLPDAPPPYQIITVLDAPTLQVITTINLSKTPPRRN